MATQTGSIDLAPMAQAAGTANNYITEFGDSGIRVHPEGDAANYSAIDADGMSVVKGGTSVAHFGETARVGAEDAYHIDVTPSGMDVKDGATTISHFGGEAEFYDPDGNKLATIGAYSDQYREGKLDFGSDLGFVAGRRNINNQFNALLLHSDFWLQTEGFHQHLHASGTDTEVYGESTHAAQAIMEASRRTESGDEDVDYFQARVTTEVSSDESIGSGYSPARVLIEAGRTYGSNNPYILLDYDTAEDDSYKSVLEMRVEEMRYAVGSRTVGIFPTYGMVGQSADVPANGYRDFTVSFGHTYASPPNVQLTLYTTSTATTFNCDIYLRSRSRTGFTARIVNRENATRSPGFTWFAIG